MRPTNMRRAVILALLCFAPAAVADVVKDLFSFSAPPPGIDAQAKPPAAAEPVEPPPDVEKIAAAAKVADDDGYVRGGEELEKLAHAAPQRAEPLLKRLARSPQPRTRALALSLLFEMKPDDATRRTLQDIATDVHAPGSMRDRAIEALAAAAWDGRDEWLLSLIQDETLLSVTDGVTTYEPFASAVALAPDRWIPRLTELLTSPNRITRSFAANALGQFHLAAARADALRPLLPWLTNADWADDQGMLRLRLIQSVAKVGLTEAIPYLLQVMEKDEDDTNRAYAAEALAQFGETRGHEIMRRAVDQIEDGYGREIVIKALDATGGLTAADLAKGLEAFLVHQLSQREPASAYLMMFSEKGTPSEVLIGLHVAQFVRDRDDVARLVIARANELRSEQPKLSAAMIDVVQAWPVAAVGELVMARIANGAADARMIGSAIFRRELLRASQSAELHRLRANGGVTAGIASVILGDAADELRILAGEDREAQRGLLAAARLVADPLGVTNVAQLFGKTKELDFAAEKYLMGEDSAAARAIVQKRHPDEILILGSRLLWDPGDDTYGSFTAWEKNVLRRFLASDATEVIVLGSASAWSAASSVAEIQVRGDRFTLAGKTLAPAAGKELLSFLASTHFDDLGPIDTGVIDGIQYEYLHLTRTSGRRVFMNNPAHAPGTPYDQFVTRIDALIE